MKIIILDRRSKDIISILAENRGPVTTKYIGNRLKISSRTVKRHMIEVEKYLAEYGFKLIKKPGYGIEIEGDLTEKNRLKQIMDEEKIEKKYLPEERQLFILIELLKSKEPIKMYKFKSDLGVTEGTISLDLDKIENMLSEYDIKLIRKPGLGVFIEGEESDLRKLIINIIYENNFQNEVLKMLGNSIQNKSRNDNLIKLNTKNKLMNMINKNTIRKVEKIVCNFEKVKKIELNDSQYVALIVHLALVVERIKNGDKIHMEKHYLNTLKHNEEFSIATELGNEIEKTFKINIPQDEIGYITMHLLGSKKYFDYNNNDFNEFFIDNYSILKVAKAMIEFIQDKSNVNLMQDDKILVNLAIHLEPAIKRMIMGMEIRNPLLDEIKENYPYIFELSKEASKIIEEEFNVEVLDAEVGYIAIHVGGALERIKNHVYKAIVVCPSGIGASRLLSSRINNEFFNIEVIDTVSTIEINKLDLSKCDFIISTVPLNIDANWILVNPLLLEEDKKKIINLINTIPLKSKEENINSITLKEKLINNINYSKAIIQILDNYKYYEGINVKNYEELIYKIAKIYTTNELSFKKLKIDILDREKLGQIILEESNTMIIHCRTNEVIQLQLGILKLLNPLIINNKTVEAVIILFAPKKCKNEYIKTMSYITNSFFKGKPIKTMTEEEIYQNINDWLEKFYNNIK